MAFQRMGVSSSLVHLSSPARLLESAFGPRYISSAGNAVEVVELHYFEPDSAAAGQRQNPETASCHFEATASVVSVENMAETPHVEPRSVLEDVIICFLSYSQGF